MHAMPCMCTHTRTCTYTYTHAWMHTFMPPMHITHMYIMHTCIERAILSRTQSRRTRGIRDW
jgi:hypothetical protein